MECICRAATAAGTWKKFKKWLFESLKWLKVTKFYSKKTKKITLGIRDFLEFLTFSGIFKNFMSEELHRISKAIIGVIRYLHMLNNSTGF